ncbi:LysR family transcriptional regulator [Paraburkholderia bannensis]|uniref:LysR family transcriptional regulator n=1 Tax=Paraburkholderia bannensis TaxID=765414 RepID=UPI002AC3193D|nr:LysR family transcriptional regulator [Paraburkholderia bannensis]
MDLYTQIQIFVWAIDSGNFSAAARDHDLAPSTVSKAIGQLEKRLDVRLFYRGPHAHTLTEEGLSYERTARDLIRAMTAAQSVGEALPQQVAGVLRIHTMATFAKHQILPRLPAFLAQYPDLSVEIQVGAQYVDLLERGVDIAIHSGVLPDSSHIAHRLGEAEWIVCASPRYIEQFGAPSEPADLLNHRCFNFAFASPWNSWSFRQNDEVITVPVKCRASFTQGDLLRDLALAGEGIVRLANFHIGDDLANGALVPLLTPFQLPLREPVYLIHADRKHPSPRIKAFLAFFSEALAGAKW